MSFKAWAQTKIPVAHRVIKTVHESKTMRIRNIYNLQPGDRIHRLSPVSRTGLRFGICDRYDGNRTYAFFGDTPDTRSTIASNDLTRNIRLGWPGYDENEVPTSYRDLVNPTPIPNPNPLGELLPNGFRVGERVAYDTDLPYLTQVRYYGTVLTDSRAQGNVPTEVWARWEPNGLGWMPTDLVFRV